MIVEATTVINFNGSDESTTSYIAYCALDDLLNVDAEGNVKTSFVPGDIVYFKYNYSSNLRLENIIATDGGLSAFGTGTYSDTVQQLFASRTSDSPSTYAPPVVTSNLVINGYYGRNGTYSINNLGFGMKQIEASTTTAPFIADISYSYIAGRVQLATPTMELDDDEYYPISVVFYFSEL